MTPADSRPVKIFSLVFPWVMGLVILVQGSNARAIDASPYCGLYAVYGASEALGKPFEFPKLLQPKYLGSSHGSTAPELLNALTDHGLSAAAFTGLGIESLRSNRCPMILHVAAGEQLEAYNHWILYLRGEGDKGVVVDAVDGTREIPLADLLARWDGNAILVDTQPLNGASIALTESFFLVQYAILSLIALFSLDRFSRTRRLRRASISGRCGQDLAMILGVSTLFGLGLHCVDSSAGFLRNPGQVAFVAAANVEGIIPKLSLTVVQTLIHSGKVTIIDARYAEDYHAGHLPGAISLPYDSPAKRRALILAKVPRDQPIVVYCQSEGCQFQDIVSNSLIREGYSNVSMFPGGWVEWRDFKNPAPGPVPRPAAR